MDKIYFDKFLFCHVINLSTWASSQQPNDLAFVPTISFHCIIVMVYKFITDECYANYFLVNFKLHIGYIFKNAHMSPYGDSQFD